jgi:tRNA(Ile)-lysidine synthase
MKPLLEHDAKARFTWNLEQDLVLPGAGVLSIAADADGDFYVPSGSVITVAFRQGGERCKVVGHAHSTLLKKLLNSVQLAPWLRDRLPLIYVDGELAALGDVAVCDGFHRQQGRQGYVLHWLRP